MNRRAIATFARRFKGAIERDGIAALERFDWSGGFFELGFEMDCGHSYEETYGLKLGDARDTERGFSSVDDILVLGNAIFSQCRYLTHWACGGDGEHECSWLVAALQRLEELVSRTSRMVVAYRFEDAVEEGIVDFCERALPGEELPSFVEYSVHDAMALDAYVDEVSCTIVLPGGDVNLEIEVGQSARRYEGQPASEREPWAAINRATCVIEDVETGDEVTLVWDDEHDSWRQAENR